MALTREFAAGFASGLCKEASQSPLTKEDVDRLNAFVRSEEGRKVLNNLGRKPWFTPKRIALYGILAASLGGAIGSYIHRKRKGLNPWTGQPVRKTAAPAKAVAAAAQAVNPFELVRGAKAVAGMVRKLPFLSQIQLRHSIMKSYLDKITQTPQGTRYLLKALGGRR